MLSVVVPESLQPTSETTFKPAARRICNSIRSRSNKPAQQHQVQRRQYHEKTEESSDGMVGLLTTAITQIDAEFQTPTSTKQLQQQHKQQQLVDKQQHHHHELTACPKQTMNTLSWGKSKICHIMLSVVLPESFQ
jgi:hypothetical protein